VLMFCLFCCLLEDTHAHPHGVGLAGLR